MRRGPVEDIRDRLALVRRECGDVDERLHRLAAGRRDHGSRIGVADENDRPGGALDGSIECCHVVGERRQRQRRRHHPKAVGGERPDDLRPAGAVGPGPMDQHDGHLIQGHRPLSSRGATEAP
jgi:hypothetical protein